MKLNRDDIVWVQAKIVDPPDHLGFIKIAVPSGYTPEPEHLIEVHATSIQGFPEWVASLSSTNE